MKLRRHPRSKRASRSGPFLKQIATLPDQVEPSQYPFNIRAFSHGIDLKLRSNVTFFVGENGSGKSTLLEAIAECCGFNPEGGNRDHYYATFADRSALAKALRLSWSPKVTEGFFLRAESFYNFATYIEQVSTLRAYGVNRSTNSLTANLFWLYSSTDLNRGFTSSTNRRRRSHHNDNFHSSRLFMTWRKRTMLSFLSPRIRRSF